MSEYVAPMLDNGPFTCPHCGAYAQQSMVSMEPHESVSEYSPARLFEFTQCFACGNVAVWYDAKLVWPQSDEQAPMPNPDIPDDARRDYLEARAITDLSSRGAAALLRLCMQRICNHLVGKETGIDAAIGKLVERGLSNKIQQALDIVRVTGNNAVHPGTMAIDDDPRVVQTLFDLVNLIVDEEITRPKRIRQMYDALPQGAREGIDRRNAKARQTSGIPADTEPS